MDTVLQSAAYDYNGRVSEDIRQAAIRCYNDYKSDREPFVARMRDNERYYRSFYDKMAHTEMTRMRCSTPLLFSCIENAAADASANFPVPNILERDPAGTNAAEALTKLLPVQLEMSRFRSVYNDNTMNKLKHGTSIYGVFYNGETKEVDIRAVDFMDVYVDVHLESVQDSRFVFISAAVDNDVLKERYPKFKALFTGDAEIEAVGESYRLTNRCEVLDCYYKKPDGTLHLMKLCKNTIIEATEDLEGYENGLYDHGQFPIVFDVMYPIKNCPYGFGMLDIGKSTQIHIDKLDTAITRNVLIAARQRYFSKRNAGINVDEFTDIENDIVHIDSDVDAVKAIEATPINVYPITHRENKKSELKELLANRDFQQGQTSGGVTAASAIEVLRETGEKRARKTAQETFETYKEIIYMVVELIRQFYDEPRTFRVSNDLGEKSFMQFDNSMLQAADGIDEETGRANYRPIQFDVEVVPQTENPYTQEQQNNTLLTLWNTGFFLPQNMQLAQVILKNMDFKGKSQLLADMQNIISQQQEQQAAQMQQAQQMMQQTPQSGAEELVPVQVSGGQGDMQAADMQSADMQAADMQADPQIPIQIGG